MHKGIITQISYDALENIYTAVHTLLKRLN